MKSNSRVLRGWRDFGVKATAIILTILLATQMVGTPAFASGALTNKQASEDIATTVDDTGVEPSGTEATDTTVPDEAAGAPNEPAPADSTQATEEPVVETVESATEPATETPAADPAANTVLGTESEPAPAPAVEQGQVASINLDIAEGATITIDGEEFASTTKQTDVAANEELKFTAAAPEGMQISAVKTVDPIAADENGEYTIAAEDVTDGLTVKVEMSAVEGEGQVEGVAVPQTLSIRAVDWQSYAVDVQFIDENEQPIDPDGVQGIPYQLDGGTISEYAPKSLVGNNGTTYDFVGAYVGNNEIEFAGSRVSSEGANTYYAVDTDSGIASLLQPGQTIALRYQTHVDRHAITYSVTGIDDSEGLVSGATSVKTGESVDFTVADVYGYTVQVSVNNSPLAGDNGVYTLDNVTSDTSVNVEYTANTTYDFTVPDSVRNSDNAHGMMGASTLPNRSDISVGNDLQFEIKTWIGAEGSSVTGYYWLLNSLEINDQTISLPRSYTEGASAATTLDNGVVVRIELAKVTSRSETTGVWPWQQTHYAYEYTYSVTVSNAKEDVNLTRINFVGSQHHEVMPHFDSQAVVVTYNGSQHGTAQNEKPIQTTGGPVNFYLDIQPGYELTGVTLDNTPIRANQDGAYRVENMNTVVKHLDISTRPIAYSVQYNMGGVEGTAPTDNTKYGLALEKNLVVASAPEADSGKVFLGWKLGDETYQPGTVLNIENILEAADDNSRTITFTAEWGDSIVDGKPVTVFVDVLLQNADGDYVRSDELSTQELAYGGDVVTVRDPMAYLKDAVDYTFNDDKTKDFIVLEGGNNRIELYFDLNKAAYTVNYYIEGTTEKVPGIVPNPVTGTGYVGQEIDIAHPELTTGYVVCDDQPTKLTVTNDGLATATVYYKVDQTQDDFAYTVNYYIEGTTEKVPGIVPNPVTGTGYVGQEIDIAHPELTTGYVVCDDQPTKLTVTNDGLATATVYYKVDQTQDDFAYTVNYYIEGTTEKVPGIVPNPVTGTGYVGQEIDIAHPELTTGYVVCDDQPTKLTVTNDGLATATVYYKVDQTQDDFAYTVNYYIEGTTEKVPGIVPNPVTGTGYVGQEIDIAHPELTTGYVVCDDQPTKLTVTNDGLATATVYYKVDQTQDDFAYTVNYYIEGTTEKVPGIVPNPVTGTGYVGQEIDIAHPELTTGYVVCDDQPTKLTVTNDGLATATVYYKVDQTQDDFAYTVNYYIEGTTEKVPGIVPNPVTGTGYVGQEIDIAHPELTTGYVVCDDQPTKLTVTNDGLATATVYYKVDQTQDDFAYTVNYYIEGTTEKVPGIVPNPVTGTGYVGQEIDIAHPELTTGYVVCDDQPTKLTVTNDGLATATVYYKVDQTQDDFAYTVNYYIEGTTEKVPGIVPNPVTGTGYVGQEIDIAHPELTTGYVVCDDQPTKLTVTNDGLATATVYYKVDQTQDDFAYTVNYYIEGTTEKVPGIVPNPVTGTGYVGQEIDIAHPELTTGYVVCDDQPTKLTVTNDGLATATVYYKVDQTQDDFAYTVNYYIEGTTEKVPGIVPNPVTGTGYVGQEIDIAHPELTTGYVVCDDQPTKLTVTNDGLATATVYYKVDQTQDDFAYTVNYYIEGTTEKVPGIVPNPVTGTGYVGQEIDIAHPELTTGYVVCDDQPTKLTVTNDGLATATVYYKVDQTQDDFAYTVNYYIEGTTEKVPGIVPNPVTGTGYVGQEIDIAHPELTTGYVVCDDQPTKLTVTNDGLATATVYYKVDQTQDDFAYTVNYYIEGTTEKVPGIVPNPVTGTGYVGQEIDIAHPELTTGYVVCDDQPTKLTVTNDGLATATVYYKVDQTQDDFAYTVNYYIEGTTEKVPGIVPNPVTGTGYVGQEIDIAHPELTTGYVVCDDQPTKLTVTNDGLATATVYYKVDQTQDDFAYTVNYYIEGTTEKVPGIVPNPVTGTGYVGQEIDIAHPELTTGYVVCDDQPTKLTVTNDGLATATVYYKVDQTQDDFAYTVNYYIEGTTEKVPGIVPNPVTGTGYVGQEIDIAHPELTTGYVVCDDQPTKLTVTNDGLATATVYYKVDQTQDDFAYTVNYYIEGTTEKVPGIVPNPVTGTGYVGQEIDIAHPELTTGYVVCDDQPTKLTVTNDGLATATVYYKVDQTQDDFAYTVNYYIEGTTEKVPGIVPNPVTGTGYVGQEIDIAHPELTTGYVVCDDQPTKLTVTNDGLATATVYYKVDQTQDDFAYTVNYYIEGTTEKVPGIVPNPVTGTGYVGQEIDIAHPELTTGYVVCDDQPTKLTVTNDGLATATVYYKVDQTQDDFAYTVNYYIEGTTEKVPGIVPNPVTGTGYVGQEIDIAHPELTTGYVVCDDQPTKLTVTNDGLATATVYYKVDQTQDDFAYTVNYYIEGTTEKVPGIVPNPVTGTGYVGQEIDIAHPELTTGYVVCDDQPTKLTVTNDGLATATVYYKVDQTQDDFAYTVNYYIEGTTEKVPGIVPNPVTGTGYVGQEIDIAHPELTTGYVVCDDQPTKLTVTNDGLATATVYYKVDQTQDEPEPTPDPDPTPTPTPDTPDTPTPLPTPDAPTPVPTPAPGDDGATPTDGLTATTGDDAEEATETIEDDATPRMAPEPIDDDATPLAANEHRDCWVHWLILLGILVTVVYYGGVGVRRVRFSSSLQSFEDDVLGNDETNR